MKVIDRQLMSVLHQADQIKLEDVKLASFLMQALIIISR